MKLKQNLILLIILIVFAAIVILVEKPFENKTEKIRQEADFLFPELQTEKIKKIQVKKDENTTITLLNRDNDWYVVDKEEYPADPQLVEEAIEKVKSLKKLNLVSRKKDKHAIFEVKEGKGMEVMLFGPDDKEIAHLFIGKSGPDLFSTYIRKAGSDETFLYDGYLKGSFDYSVNNWRDKTIFDFDVNQVDQLKIAKKKETIVLSKDTEGNWHIEQPISSLGEKSEVEKVLRTLSQLKATGFASEDELKETGLENPEYQISATLKDGRKKTLIVGNKKGEHQYYVKNDEKKYVYILYQSTVKDLTPSIKDLEKVETKPEEEKEKSSGKKDSPSQSQPR